MMNIKNYLTIILCIGVFNNIQAGFLDSVKNWFASKSTEHQNSKSTSNHDGYDEKTRSLFSKISLNEPIDEEIEKKEIPRDFKLKDGKSPVRWAVLEGNHNAAKKLIESAYEATPEDFKLAQPIFRDNSNVVLRCFNIMFEKHEGEAFLQFFEDELSKTHDRDLLTNLKRGGDNESHIQAINAIAHDNNAKLQQLFHNTKTAQEQTDLANARANGHEALNLAAFRLDLPIVLTLVNHGAIAKPQHIASVKNKLTILSTSEAENNRLLSDDPYVGTTPSNDIMIGQQIIKLLIRSMQQHQQAGINTKKKSSSGDAASLNDGDD